MEKATDLLCRPQKNINNRSLAPSVDSNVEQPFSRTTLHFSLWTSAPSVDNSVEILIPNSSAKTTMLFYFYKSGLMLQCKVP